jgi:hypothetical protein
LGPIAVLSLEAAKWLLSRNALPGVLLHELQT